MGKIRSDGKAKICCVTGTRADYPRIRPVLRLLKDHPDFDLSLIVTGSHLWINSATP